MIKKTFTITPESGSNNGSISINAKANTDTNAIQETIAITGGGGINKSINLLQKGYIDVYTTEQYVYALYSGKTIKDATSGAFESNQVLVFDWSGNPVTKYALDIFVTEICISPDDAVLYAISNKPDPELIYFNLKSN